LHTCRSADFIFVRTDLTVKGMFARGIPGSPEVPEFSGVGLLLLSPFLHSPLFLKCRASRSATDLTAGTALVAIR
jgi:hypothetical protein